MYDEQGFPVQVRCTTVLVFFPISYYSTVRMTNTNNFTTSGVLRYGTFRSQCEIERITSARLFWRAVPQDSNTVPIPGVSPQYSEIHTPPGFIHIQDVYSDLAVTKSVYLPGISAIRKLHRSRKLVILQLIGRAKPNGLRRATTESVCKGSHRTRQVRLCLPTKYLSVTSFKIFNGSLRLLRWVISMTLTPSLSIVL